MNIEIILEGKLRESFYQNGAMEYHKRLLGKVKIVETDNILNLIKNKKDSYIVTLEIEGKELTSVEFASKIREIEQEGYYREILFLIGGATGLSKEVRALSNFKFSLSKLTFLHQEATLILIEQIYRARRILNNEPYHK